MIKNKLIMQKIEVDMDLFSRRIGPYFSWLESKIESIALRGINTGNPWEWVKLLENAHTLFDDDDLQANEARTAFHKAHGPSRIGLSHHLCCAFVRMAILHCHNSTLKVPDFDLLDSKQVYCVYDMISTKWKQWRGTIDRDVKAIEDSLLGKGGF